MKYTEREVVSAVTIRDGAEGDLDKIAALYDEARKSMRALGIDQWQQGTPNRDTAAADMKNGILRVLTENGVILAAAAVYVGHEPTYDVIYGGGWALCEPRYGIIHRIAVAPDLRRRGAASAIMDYCAEISLAAKVRSLRCDTHYGNTPMRRTLEKNGYVLRGTILLADGAERAAYEKIL